METKTLGRYTFCTQPEHCTYTLQECVACGTVYLSEGDSEGWQRLIPISSTTSPCGEISGKSPQVCRPLHDDHGTPTLIRTQPIQLPTLDPAPPTNVRNAHSTVQNTLHLQFPS